MPFAEGLQLRSDSCESHESDSSEDDGDDDDAQDGSKSNGDDNEDDDSKNKSYDEVPGDSPEKKESPKTPRTCSFLRRNASLPKFRNPW